MALTETQIENVREIIFLSSYEATETLLSNLNSVQETATLADLTEFAKVKNNFKNIKIDGIEIAPEVARLAIRNRLRVRLGLTPLESETDIYGGSGHHTIEYSNPAICE